MIRKKKEIKLTKKKISISYLHFRCMKAFKASDIYIYLSSFSITIYIALLVFVTPHDFLIQFYNFACWGYKVRH